MKFGKCLGQTIKDVPSEWRPFAIQYKSLKRCIHKIVQELNDKGISRDILEALLDAAEAYKMEYSSEINPNHIRSYIKLDLDAYSSDIRSSHPLTEHSLESIQSDFMKFNLGSVSSLSSLPSTDSLDTESTISDPHYDLTAEAISVYNNPSTLHGMTYIELQTDGEFFDTLLEEMSQLNHLQQQNKDDYMDKVKKLDNNLIDVTSPYKKDMYTWREIFQLYLQAEIFIGTTEADRNEHDWENAQNQFKWFTDELSKTNLLHKFKLNSSRETFREFLGINNDLMIMKRFQYLNKTAMSKILKKHDKQTCLAASPNFEKLLERNSYFTGNLGKSLCHVLIKLLSTITPQLEDHTCPVCTFIYWKPIRLYCGHVFCVRCIIKANNKKMRNCPICRSEDAVYKADSSNLDKPLQNFIKLYFPREVNAKKEENGKQEIEELMGNSFSGTECRIS
ncbi:SPX domain-containing protein [Glomus cerebriforme]|uniref:SPX domain-containing protein n=1 Tax=Glomus cerebriforme TaxID=658196 RepID=A0A397TLS5_9GLOM|nr:SPX domain-containing protein [Glomus cerebriforme]